MHVAEEAWTDLEGYFGEESLALVPLGSTEQHGPHLPEGTDHFIAEALAREAAARTGYLCTPTVTVGVSSHHRQFPGTMWVDAATFRSFVRSLTTNLTKHGIDRVIYVNAHGGNVEALREVGRYLREDRIAYAIEWMWDESIPELVDDLFDVNGPHGGPKETAMIQYLHGELVHDDRLEAARDGGLVDWGDDSLRTYGALTHYDAIDNTPNGVLGDQTDATAEKGEQLFEAATEQLVKLCEWVDDQPFEALMPAGDP